MGDVLITSPAIKALKNSNKNRKITLLTSNSGAQIAKYIPEIDHIIPFDVPWVKIPNISISQKILKLIKDLKSYRFDAAVIFTNFSQNPLPQALTCFLADIPKRLGFCRENPYQLLTDWVVDKEPFEFIDHGVLRQLRLVEKIGIKRHDESFSFRVPEKAYVDLETKLQQLKINKSKKRIILHPGVSELKRQYPPNLFVIAAKMILRDLNYQIFLTGDSSEKNLTLAMKKAIGPESFSLAGELNIDSFAALINTADLLISNNTLPIHIASAVNTPVVVMYARTNPEHTPWKVKNEVLYFDVPEHLKSKNQLLKLVAPQKPTPLPQPIDIFNAARKLLSWNSFHHFKQNNSQRHHHI